MSVNDTPNPDPTVVDFEVLDRLQREITPEITKVLLDEFAGGLLARLGQLDGLISDPQKVAAEAHIIKSEAATFGAPSLASSIQAVETAAASGKSDSLGKLLETARCNADCYVNSLMRSNLLRSVTI